MTVHHDVICVIQMGKSNQKKGKQKNTQLSLYLKNETWLVTQALVAVTKKK